MIMAGLEPSMLFLHLSLMSHVGQTPFFTRRAWLIEMGAKPALAFGVPFSFR